MTANSQVEVEDRIKQLLVRELGVNPAKTATSSSNTPLLGRGIGLDSIETLALVAGIEEEFDIQVEDADLTVGLFRDIGTLAAYVVQKTAPRRNGSMGGAST